jgi:hypothetical protein
MSLPNVPAPRKPARTIISVRIDSDTALRFRELCFNYSGLPHWLRQNEIMERLLRQFIIDFERKLAEADATKPRDQEQPARNSNHRPNIPIKFKGPGQVP